MFVRLLLVSLLLAPTAARADDWRQCLAERGTLHSARALLTLTHVDRVGDEREARAWVHWERLEAARSQFRIEVTGPADVRGTVLTLDVEEGELTGIRVRLPELEGERRLTGRRLRTPLLGSDLTLEDLDHLADLLRVLGSDRSDPRRRAAPGDDPTVIDGIPVGGRATWRIALRTDRGKGSPYDTVVSYVDRDTCVPLRTELSRGDRVRKVVRADPAWIGTLAGRFVARRWRIEDVADGSRTLVALDLLAADPGPDGPRTARVLPREE